MSPRRNNSIYHGGNQDSLDRLREELHAKQRERREARERRRNSGG